MAQKIIVELTDDTDGGEAHRTVSFAVRGVEYEIDLSDANAANFEEALAPYVAHARHVRGRDTGRNSTRVDAKAVRVWAATQGLDVAPEGRVPYEIVDRYRTACFG